VGLMVVKVALMQGSVQALSAIIPLVLHHTRVSTMDSERGSLEAAIPDG
jgi:hypothetical protein